MKKVILIVVSLFITQLLNAQQPAKKHFSAEQRANLKTKKLTLALDLNKTQQKEMYKFQLELAKARDARKNLNKELKKKPLTSNEKYEKINRNLDRKIEIKKRFKQILTPVQYEKWEKIRAKRARKHKKKHSKLIFKQKDRR